MWSRTVTDPEKNLPFFQQMEAEGYSGPQGEVCVLAHLNGRVDKGDSAQIEAFIVANLPFLTGLELNSKGGNVSESMEIGRLLRRYYLATEAPQENGFGPSWLRPSPEIFVAEPGATCVSACFFVWLGGITRGGDYIGIHRPFPTIAEMQRMSPAQADQSYRDLSNTIRSYLAEMGAAQHWLDDMMRVASEAIHVLSKQEVSELVGQTFGDVPSIAQWKSAHCGSLSDAELKDIRGFIALKINKLSVPSNRRIYKEALMNRWEAIIRCGQQALILARWRARELDQKK